MKTLMMDIEACSGADLAKCGAYRYAEDPDFEVLLLACSAEASWGARQQVAQHLLLHR